MRRSRVVQRPAPAAKLIKARLQRHMFGMTGQTPFRAVPSTHVRSRSSGQRQGYERRTKCRGSQILQRRAAWRPELIERVAQTRLALIDGHTRRGIALEVLNVCVSLLYRGGCISDRHIVLKVEPL